MFWELFVCYVGIVLDIEDILVKEIDRIFYFMNFIKELYNKYKIVNISVMKKRYKVL